MAKAGDGDGDGEADGADPRLESAWGALEAGDIAAARREAAGLDREAPETLLLLAACAREEGDGEQALALTGRAAEVAPDWATPALWRAELLAGDPERLEEALTLAARAVDLADDEDEYLSALALKAGLEVELGQTEEARQTLQDLPPPEVRLGDLQVGLEIADLHLAVGEVETARDRLRAVCEEFPDSPDAWHALGVAAAELDDEQEMLAAWKRTWELDSAPGERPADERLSEEELAAVAEAALRELPDRARELLAGIPIVVAELPAEADVEAGLDPRALGLFSGTAHPDAPTGLGGQPGLTQIVLFRRNLERTAVDADELREEVRVTLLHEAGHFFGLSDRELEEMGLG